MQGWALRLSDGLARFEIVRVSVEWEGMCWCLLLLGAGYVVRCFGWSFEGVVLLYIEVILYLDGAMVSAAYDGFIVGRRSRMAPVSDLKDRRA
jgi:hypothetical protein